MSPILCIKRLIVAKGVGLPEAGSAPRPVIVNKDNLGALECTRMLRLWQIKLSQVLYTLNSIVGGSLGSHTWRKKLQIDSYHAMI